jgi:hypothetical protein
MKKIVAVLIVFIFSVCQSFAKLPEPVDINNLPENFPHITAHIYDSNAIGEGYIFITAASDSNSYLMMLNNNGTPFYYKQMENPVYDFKVQPSGLLTYAQSLDPNSSSNEGNVVHKVMKPDFDEIDSFQMSNGFIADFHDFKILPNGHALLIGNYMTQMDLSGLVDGGDPNAMVCGNVVQELDAFKNAIFQWRTWDYYNPEEMDWSGCSGQPVVTKFCFNAVNPDNDGQILLTSLGHVIKVSRQTGDIIWQLGGRDNQFTFIGIDPNEAVNHFGGNDFHRLPNDNVLIYNNSDYEGTRSSKVFEYKLDEENKTAELIWQYIPDPNIYGWNNGNAQRLPNGNTFISWGQNNINPCAACTEISNEGKVVWELSFDDPNIESYRAYRIPFPPEVPAIEVQKYELATGNTYVFSNGQSDTGVSIKVKYREGEGYNDATVKREPFAPLNPEFPGVAPQALPVRVIISQNAIYLMNADISFDVNSFEFDDPNSLIVYYRPYKNKGLFIPLPTVYNYVTEKVRATVYAQMGYGDDIGEFVFGYPDLEHIVNAPILIEPKDNDIVNPALPISFFWAPKGFVNYYHLQIASDLNYETLLVDEKYLVESLYTLDVSEPNTVYYWRVSIINDAGESSWSQDSFETVSPFIDVTVPN